MKWAFILTNIILLGFVVCIGGIIYEEHAHPCQEYAEKSTPHLRYILVGKILIPHHIWYKDCVKRA